MIHAEALTKFYERHCVVRELSFTIQDREIVGFLGLNGAGKTTTLRMLAGLLMPSSGRIEIDGRDLLDDPEALRWRIGFLPERPPLYDDMSVRDYLAFAARLRGTFTDAGLAERIASVLHRTALEQVANEPISTLSHGFRQRVGIAQAIIHDPALVILDEPINGLDPAQIVEMRKLIRGLREHHTVLLSSHILSEISQTCDRLLIIQNGQLVDEGTESQLLAKHGGDGRSFWVTAKGDRKAMESALVQRELVAGFEIVREQPDEKLVELRVELGRSAPEELAELLVSSGFGLKRLEPVKSELETMFLKLTGTQS